MWDIAFATAVHVAAVVWWIGGLAFVSTVALPQLRQDPDRAIERFHGLEKRFAPQVRLTLILVGASGGWLLYRTGLWRVVAEPYFWWLSAMIALWTLFVLMLFVLGPSGVLRRVMSGPLERDPATRLKRMHRLHVLLLVIAIGVIVGAVTGNHG